MAASWFEVDLKTLRLKPAPVHRWPASMRDPKSRMKEECLESLVAFNLDVLFPGEDLLLVNTQDQIHRAADITAIDPLGVLRVIELKKTPGTYDDLLRQVISYAIGNFQLQEWRRALAEEVTAFPERVSLALEGFRANERAKSYGESDVKAVFPRVAWKDADRFEQARFKAAVLRASCGGRGGKHPLKDPRVRDVCARLYGLPVRNLAYGDPEQVVEQIVKRRWAHSPKAVMTEFTLIAPSIAGAERAEHDLATTLAGREREKICANLIDADLRCETGRTRVLRALLRWQPCHRRIDTRRLQELVKFKKAVLQADPEAGRFHAELPDRFLWWEDLSGSVLMELYDEDGSPEIATCKTFLTQGFREMGQRRRQELLKLLPRLRRIGASAFTKDGEISVPWHPRDFSPAVRLMVEHYRLCRRLGFRDDLQWYRRPKEARR